MRSIVLPELLIAAWLVLLPCVGLAQETAVCTSFPLEAPVRQPVSAAGDLRHVSIEIDVRPDEHVLLGRAVLDLDFEEPADSLLLVATAARVDSILAAAGTGLLRSIPFEYLGPDTFAVRFDSLLQAELDSVGALRLDVAYRTDAVRFDSAAVWSVDEEAWFPQPGSIEDRFTTDLALTVPAGWIVAASGMQATQGRGEAAANTFVFSSPYSLPARRIAFAAGAFEPSTDFAALAGGRRVAVTQLDGRSHPETGDIVSFMSEWTGFPYPFERYAQLVAADLQPVSGAGIGITPESAVVDERARTEYLPAADLAPPVARQWFGSVVSAASWADRWLEDGLSSYLTAAYMEDAEGEEVYFMRMNSLRRMYLAEAEQYVRPLVWDRWNHPSELDDSHSRGKGAWVAHMLRHRLGDEVFRDVLADFLTSNSFKSVSTETLVASAETVAGLGAATFLDPWLYAAGHPILEVSYEQDDEGLLVRIAQTQAGDHVPQVFPLDLTLEIGGLGSTERFEVAVDERSEDFRLPFPSTPRFMAVDPDGDWLLQAQINQPASAWIGQLRYATTTQARLRAAEALANFSDDPALLIGLRAPLEQEQSALVRAAIIRAVGAMSRSDASERMLIAALEDPSPMVRRNALAALAGSDRAAALALEAAERDSSNYVQAEAVRLLAAIGAENALGVARSALVTPSHDDVIRAAGLDAFVQLRALGPDGALEAGLHYSEPGKTTRLRLAAVRLLGRLAEGSSRAADRLAELVASENRAVAFAAAEQLNRIGDAEGLRKLLGEASRPSVRSYIQTLLTCD